MVKTQNDIKELVLKNISNKDFTEILVTDGSTEENYSYITFFERCYDYYRDILLKTECANIVCVLNNGIELFTLYFAVMMSDKRIVVIDSQKGKQEIDLMLDSISDKFIIVDSYVEQRMKNYDYNIINKQNVIFDNSFDVKKEVLFLLANRNFNSDYLLTFTSGTTGLNKGVRHSLSNLFWSAYEFNNCFKVDKNNVFGHFMPMTYMAGILNTIFQPFLSGSKVVIMGKFSPMMAISFWQNIIKYAINTIWVSPGMLTLIDKLGSEAIGSGYCKKNNLLFFVGTAPLADEFQKQFEQKFNVDLYASYGLSETLFISTETKETKECKNKVNVGRFINNVEYLILDDSELQVKVPWMFLGYSNDNTDTYFNQRYYKTGDFAEENDGVLTILGRKKDLVVRGGFNISPAIIENVVNNSTLVEECAVFGIFNTKINDENIVLVYTSDNEANSNIVDVNSLILEKLGRNYMIDDFFCIKKMSRNINGKIDKNDLKELYLNSKIK